MRSFSFTVIGIPLAMPRVRATATIMRIGGKLRAISKVYTPEDDDVNKWKHDIAYEALRAYQRDFDTGPTETLLAADMTFAFPRSQALTWKKKAMLRTWYRDTPDLDNLIKAAFDALNGVVFRDDRQVVRVTSEKIFAAGDEPPRLVAKFTEMPSYQDFYKEQNGPPISPENQQLQADNPD